MEGFRMATRKQVRKRVEVLQKELRRLTDALTKVRNEGDRLYSQHVKVLDELRVACNILGLTWAEGCPSYKEINKEAHCIIYEWQDQIISARFCINCPISHEEASVRVLMCKLKPEVKKDE